MIVESFWFIKSLPQTNQNHSAVGKQDFVCDLIISDSQFTKFNGGHNSNRFKNRFNPFSLGIPKYIRIADFVSIVNDESIR